MAEDEAQPGSSPSKRPASKISLESGQPSPLKRSTSMPPVDSMDGAVADQPGKRKRATRTKSPEFTAKRLRTQPATDLKLPEPVLRWLFPHSLPSQLDGIEETGDESGATGGQARDQGIAPGNDNVAASYGEDATPSQQQGEPRDNESASPLESFHTAVQEDSDSRVLKSPTVSPLSTPSSSPKLSPLNSSAMEVPPTPGGSEAELDVVESDAQPQGSTMVMNNANDNEDSSTKSDTAANNVPVTPGPSAPQQLPTPASSNSSDAEVFKQWSGAGLRSIKKPIRYGDIVETPVLSEEAIADDDSDFEETPTTKQATKRKAPPKTKGATPGSTKVKPAVATPKTTSSSTSKVTKSAKANVSPKKAAARKSATNIRGTPKKGAQANAEVKVEEAGEAVAPKSKKTTATSRSTKAKTTDSQVTTTPKGRKSTQVATKPRPTATKQTPSSRSKVVPLPVRPDIYISDDKLALSYKMTHREPIESKPEPSGKPEVWAESRQALCETLPYFKKPQGGCYSNDGHVYAFLFDGVGHCREYVDENVILCRAGGSMEPDLSGGMVQKKDQLMTESQVMSVWNDMKHHNPLIVICGNRNVAARSKMPHQYSVLGWYKPTLIWAEKTAGKGTKVWKTIKYRLERLNEHLGPAWHAPNDESVRISDEERQDAGAMTMKPCQQCNKDYPQIYLQGWMCLNPECEQFWKVGGVDAPTGSDGLDYDPAFLLHRYPAWKDDTQDSEPVPGDLKPALPDVGNAIGDNLLYVNTRGICCQKCGRCNSRRKFKGWECEAPGCGWTFTPEHRVVAPAMLHTPWDAAPTLVRNKHASAVNVEIIHIHGYKASKYTFGDEIKGCFIHIAANKQLNEEQHGPNDMFKELQTVDMGLERRVFAVTKLSGGRSDKPKDVAKDGQSQPSNVEDTQPREPSAGTTTAHEDLENGDENHDKPSEEFAPGDLMTAFSMNYGMPYKFVASGGSQSFDSAPFAVTECRRRLNWAQKTFLGNQEEYIDFNEQLIFAYLEGQKIEYHDDGESGLGPRIATLSLGGRAKMHMRMKAKHYVGCSKTGIFTEEKPVPGSIGGDEMYKKRLEKWEELQTLKGDTAVYNKRRKEVPKELEIFDKKMKKADDLVTVTLSHGDIIIMDGYDIQKYLEHKVVPEGYLRFALTCRTVLPDHLKPEELPTYDVGVDPVVYEGPQLTKT